MRISADDVVKYCQVVPIGMLDGLNTWPHADDCSLCQYCTLTSNEDVYS